MEPLASVEDVEAMWRPVSGADVNRVAALISTASAKLRQKAPFDIDARMLLFRNQPRDPIALDPAIVANVVATIVKRYLINQDGVASSTESAGPFAKSQTYVSRYDRTGSDVRGALQVVDADIDELRPSVPRRTPVAVQMVPTRAMEPEPGYWPNGYRPRIDGATGDPVFGFPYDRSGHYWGDGNGLNPALPMPRVAGALQQHIDQQTVTSLRVVSADATAVAGELLLVTTGDGPVRVTLPALANGALVVVTKVDAGLGSVAVVAQESAQTINSEASYSISAVRQTVSFVSDGAQWWAA